VNLLSLGLDFASLPTGGIIACANGRFARDKFAATRFRRRGSCALAPTPPQRPAERSSAWLSLRSVDGGLCYVHFGDRLRASVDHPSGPAG